MNVLMVNLPFSGHTNPTLPLTAKLVEAGHKVTYVNAPEFREKIEQTGATFVPYKDYPENASEKYRKGRFEDIKHIRDGYEFWSARELSTVLDYSKWENFDKVIKRAIIACENSGHSVDCDFPEVGKIVKAGATEKTVRDYELSRYPRQRKNSEKTM